jgi:diguanylate cyclase
MITAVADAYNAMTSKRTYQKTKTKDEALTELINCSGTQFNPAIADVFIRMLQDGFQV